MGLHITGISMRSDGPTKLQTSSKPPMSYSVTVELNARDASRFIAVFMHHGKPLMRRRHTDPMRWRHRQQPATYFRFIHDWVSDDAEKGRVVMDASLGGGRGFDLED